VTFGLVTFVVSVEYPCQQWGICSQRCHEIQNRPFCACVEGYSMDDDQFTCKPQGKRYPGTISQTFLQVHQPDYAL